MFSRPAALPRWATGGGALITAPSSGAQDSGHAPDTALTAQLLNWQQNLTYQWLAFLDQNNGSSFAAACDAASNMQKATLGSVGMSSYAGCRGTLRACGTAGKLIRSVDGGRSWTSDTAGSSYSGDFNQIAYAPTGTGQPCVAVGGGTSLQRSGGNSGTWTQDLSAGFNLNAVASGNNLFVVTGASGTYTSPIASVSWTLHSSPANAPNSLKLGFGAGLFVGGDSVSGKVCTSADGVTWSLQTTGLPAGTSLAQIAYDAAFGFVATFVASGPVWYILTSPDAINWSIQATSNTDVYQRLAILPNMCFVGVLNSNLWKVWDGSTFRTVYIPEINGLASCVSDDTMSGGAQYTLIGQDGSGGFYTARVNYPTF